MQRLACTAHCTLHSAVMQFTNEQSCLAYMWGGCIDKGLSYPGSQSIPFMPPRLLMYLILVIDVLNIYEDSVLHSSSKLSGSPMRCP